MRRPLTPAQIVTRAVAAICNTPGLTNETKSTSSGGSWRPLDSSDQPLRVSMRSTGQPSASMFQR